MEHLPLPQDPIEPRSLMPLFATDIYDGGPFLEYLDRHPNTLFSSEEHATYEITNDEVTRHFQGWLFFGLLQECFGESFDHDDFVRYSETMEHLVLTTKVLPERLLHWRDEYLQNVDACDEEFAHLESCLDEVATMLKKAPWHFPDYNESLGLQIDIIASVAETIEHCISEVNEEFGKPIIGGYGLRRNWLQLSHQRRNDVIDQCDDKMRKYGGWCPYDITMAKQRFQTCEAWHFLQNLKLEGDPERHGSCNEERCDIVSTSEGPCLPSHNEENCCCASFEVEGAVLEEIYKCNRIPCLKFTSSQGVVGSTFTASVEADLSVTVEALDMDQDSVNQYVAISHVWSNGTGNSTANSLPNCQLWYMHRQAQVWRDANFPENRNQPLYMWIDTICCPYENGPGKWLALSRMTDIYGNAAFVLVIDRQLIAWEAQQVRRKGLVECLVRLYFSPWMKRLWTCQEAILAGRKQRHTVIVQFGSITWDWTSLYVRAAREGQLGRRLAMDVGKDFIWLEKGIWFGDDKFPPLGSTKLLAHVLRYRSTSVAADEALILSNLLKFDSRQFIGRTQEEAMCRFWKEVSDTEAHNILGDSLLSKQVVFYPTARLQTAGFRWAPKSFLNPQIREIDPFFSSDTQKYPASLTPRGILASYPGCRIYKDSKYQGLCIHGKQDCESGTASLIMPMADGSWRMTADNGDLGLELGTHLQLVHKYNLCLLTHSIGVPEERMYTYALYVHLEEIKDGIKYGRILRPTLITQAQSNSVVIMEATSACAMSILEELGTERHNSGDQVDVDKIRSVSERHVREYLIHHPHIQDNIKLDTRNNVYDRKDYTFDDCVRSFTVMVHYFCHSGRVSVEEYPDDALWCLD